MDSQSRIEYRTLSIAEYIIQHRSTIRQAAEAHFISKSCVHSDIHNRLPRLNRDLYDKVCIILQENWRMRFIRGGEATAKVYAERRQLSGT